LIFIGSIILSFGSCIFGWSTYKNIENSGFDKLSLLLTIALGLSIIFSIIGFICSYALSKKMHSFAINDDIISEDGKIQYIINEIADIYNAPFEKFNKEYDENPSFSINATVTKDYAEELIKFIKENTPILGDEVKDRYLAFDKCKDSEKKKIIQTFFQEAQDLDDKNEGMPSDIEDLLCTF
jgi:hypothetical protein